MRWSVIGHKAQKEQFERALAGGALAHAYLFHGPYGVGKRIFADELAIALLSNEHLSLEQNPDCVLLGTEVEQVRDMKQWAYLRPLYGTRKVVLIDDAERMSDAAANTVLKVLEEPPAYLYFILVSSQPKRVLSTITSRCQDVAFGTLDADDMRKILTGSVLDADDKELLTAVAFGRPGEALCIVREKKLKAVAQAIADLERMLHADVAERLIYAKQVAENEDARRVVAWWLAWMHSRPPSRPHYTRIMHGLLTLHDTLAESKYNRRLAIERFFLEL